MAVKVKVPSILRGITGGLAEVTANGSSLKEVINDLERQYNGLYERICEENGEIRRFVNIYVNNEDVRFLDGLDTVVKDGDTVLIIPAIAGGGCRFLGVQSVPVFLLKSRSKMATLDARTSGY